MDWHKQRAEISREAELLYYEQEGRFGTVQEVGLTALEGEDVKIDVKPEEKGFAVYITGEGVKTKDKTCRGDYELPERELPGSWTFECDYEV